MNSIQCMIGNVISFAVCYVVYFVNQVGIGLRASKRLCLFIKYYNRIEVL